MSSRSGCCVALLLAALCVMGCTAQDSNAPKAPPSPDVPSSPISLPGEEPKPKPAAPEPLGSVEYIKKMIDSPLDDIQWVDEQVVFVISEKGDLYRSDTAGRAWNIQTPNFESKSGTAPKIQSMMVSEVDASKIVFLTNGRTFWTTLDKGVSYIEGDKNIRDIRLHPTQALWMLGSTMSDACEKRTSEKEHCFKTLWVSRDFGASWEHCVDYVVQFDWSPAIGSPDSNGNYYESDHLMYATINRKQEGDQRFGVWDKNIHFESSNDNFKNSRILVEHGNRFLFGDYALLFVAKVDPQHETEVSLMVSRDNTTHLSFNEAVLPVQLSEHSYTILDTSEGAVFLHVNHQPFSEGAYAGHVYASDWSGLIYTLTLPYNHRSADGKCDFEKVDGLEGIYLANFIDEEEMDQEMKEEKNPSKSKAKPAKGAKPVATPVKKRHERLHTKTVITFDKGAHWSYLPAPTVDSLGKPINCKGCTLHLHGITDMYGPFYSAESATGLIMATGTVGTYLQQNKDQVNTYLSRDGGLSWKEVRKGSHIYEFGDHGGLIVMASDTAATNVIYYSWDEGATWNEQKISEEKFMIENIIIEPTAVSQQLIVYGWQGDAGILIFMNFDSLHQRVCVGHDAPDAEASDYETWTPSDDRMTNGKCLMGHKVSYVRRKQFSQCFNPEEFERPTSYENCPCQASDFECDWGYERKLRPKPGDPSATTDNPGLCVPAATPPLHANPFSQHSQCSSSKTFRVTKGYRRVPGDTCEGGAEFDAIETPCPSSWGQSTGKVVGLIFLLAVFGLGIVACGSKYDCVENMKASVASWCKRLGYKFLPGHEAPPSAVDDLDEDGQLDDDEFATSAQLIGSKPAGKGAGAGGGAGSGAGRPSGVDFQPLPTSTKQRSAAAGGDDDFNPRGRKGEV